MGLISNVCLLNADTVSASILYICADSESICVWGIYTAHLTANEGLYQTFVILACVCWGFEKDTRQIVIIKGLGSGTASLLISFVIYEGAVGITAALAVMILGFLAVGLSVYFYVLAQGEIGAARTSAYYAVSPFMGVLLSLLIFRQMPGKFSGQR